jgi:hypothetical protein
MNQWTFAHLASIDKQALLASQDLGTEGLAEAPALLWKPLIAAYLRGEGFLVRTAGLNLAMKAADVEDVRAAFENPPRSSEQILHPDKYWNRDERDEPRKIELDTSRLPKGWTVLGEDTLGELYLGLLTTPMEQRKGFDAKNPMAVLGIKYTNPTVEGWGGDRVVLLGRGEERLLQLVTLWDSPEDAAEFQRAIVPDEHAPTPHAWPIGSEGGFVMTGNARRDEFVVITIESRTDTADAGRLRGVPWSESK